MHWNNAWEDDAFAKGKIPGWVDWLNRRRQDSKINIVDGLNNRYNKRNN